MTRFVVQRAIRSVVTLLIVVTAIFFVLRLSGDPAVIMLGPDATLEAQAAFRLQHGLGDPLWQQYLLYLGGILRGDLGVSLQYDQPVSDLFLQRAPATLELAASALAIALLIGIPVGIIAALNHNTAFDRVSMLIAFVGQSAPGFFVGIMLILILSLQLNLLPSSGRGTPQQLIMPAVTLAAGLLAALARMTRSSLLEVAEADYIRTARAKGLARKHVVAGHMLRNAAIPVVTMLGLWVSGIIGGAAITETVFAWPGVGRLIVDAVSGRDYPVVQSVILIVAATVILANLVVDLAYGWLDPRITVTRGAR